MNFSELKLIRPLLRAVEEQGYEKPSPIQQKAIPPVLAGHDLLGCAQTGTGKTAAFALPILQQLAAFHPDHKGVRALILTPTRELALQIDDCFAAYGKYLNVSHTVIFGGVGQAPQVEALKRGTDVLTACPGRLNDLIGQGHVDLSHLEIFVLDEADRMLDMGFVHDVKKVLRHLPAKRQNLLFSATMPKEIENLAASILRRPVSVKVDPPASTVDRIEQSVYKVEKADKKRLLAVLVAKPEVKNALVFSRTKHGANAIATFLQKRGVGAAAIHGNKSQTARVKALEDFKAGRIKALVATDIAARGIDISSLSHVFQLDLPEVPETYVHRIGRTGRAGAEGTAVSFCSPEEEGYLAGIEKVIRKKIPVLALPALPPKGESGAKPRQSKTESTPRQEKQPAPKKEKPERNQGKAPSASVNEPTARAHRAEMEESSMPENNQKPAEGQQPLSASAKRRRRRRRAAVREEQAGAAVNQQNTQQSQPRQKAGQPRSNAPKREDKPQKNQNNSRQNNQSRNNSQKPVRPAKQQVQPVKRAAAQKPQVNDDPGLELISRRPPAQKFASFEEFLKSRGLGGSEPEASGEE